MSTNKNILTIEEIKEAVKPLAKNYHFAEVYLFGSYARGTATEESDMDLLVIGGNNFIPIKLFSFAEKLRRILQKDIDCYEIREINIGSDFYEEVMKERRLVA
jgi:predicted nucleotidyltransferase